MSSSLANIFVYYASSMAEKRGASSSHKQPVHPKIEPSPTQQRPRKIQLSQKKFQLSHNHFLTFKWLRQAPDGALYCQPCRSFPNVSKSWEQFVKGWNGTASGFKFEPFHLHEKKDWHLKCVEKFVAGGQQLINAVVPEMKAWKPKIWHT